jgi:hypothetical protein
VALGLVGLGVVVHMLRSRRFYERAIIGAIVLGALRGLGQENRASVSQAQRFTRVGHRSRCQRRAGPPR